MGTLPIAPVVNLGTLSAAVTEEYQNWIVDEVNASCLRLAVMTGEYPWHRHETSDELFVVLEGELTVDFSDGHSATLRPLDLLRVPAGVVHRTRASHRTVNLTVEHTEADTVFVNGPARDAARRERDGGKADGGVRAIENSSGRNSSNSSARVTPVLP